MPSEERILAANPKEKTMIVREWFSPAWSRRNWCRNEEGFGGVLKLKLILLNLLLVIALSAIVWQARVRWDEAQATRRNNLSAKVTPNPAPPLIPAPKPDAAPAAKFADVATKNLFSKDRNPTVVIDPPKIEEQKKMPSLPVVYGVLGLPSGTKAIMAEKSGAASRSVHAGDTIGEFKIASLDSQNIVFDWDGKQISKKIEDLIDRSNAGGQEQLASCRAEPWRRSELRRSSSRSNKTMRSLSPPVRARRLLRDSGHASRATRRPPVRWLADTRRIQPRRPSEQCVPGCKFSNGRNQMKSIIIALSLCAAAPLRAARHKEKEHHARPPPALTIPKDAVPNPDGKSPSAIRTRRGKKWTYTKTPFGVLQSRGRGCTAFAPTASRFRFDKGHR